MASTLTSFGWFTKFKLHHLFFWAAYHYLWWSLHEESMTAIFRTLQNTPYLIKYSSYVLFQALGVYFCLYYLIPRFLEQRKYVHVLVLLAATIMIVSFCILGGYHLSAWVAGEAVTTLFNVDSQWVLLKNNAFGSSLASMTLGMSIKLSKNWIESQRRQQELEKEKLETELKFLKSQFNPHFLFNTINSIFVLINKNTTLASEALAKFSGLLRYQLYECNEGQIPLNRELAYLDSFIELQKLRLETEHEVKVNLLQTYKGNLTIAPFILMPFIENAFKHVSQGKNQLNWIRLEQTLQGNELTFHISNSYDSSASREVVKYGGLGLKNAQRRLELIYPKQHQLTVEKRDGVHLVKLRLRLREQLASEIVLVES
ncbi:MAG: histidine kinase [Bacteroidota bacterium]